MHIDHSKLVELLAEAVGIEQEKVEGHLTELIAEIQDAIAEGDAYEVNGLGVFSGIGNNILFIPSDDLATEINYKYVGMEPIEMDAPEEDEAPKEEKGDETAPEDDPFAGLLDDEAGSESDTETHASFELDKDETEDLEDFAGEDAEEAPFDLADEDLEDDTEEQLPEETDEEYKPGPDDWGIDTYKDEGAESMFSGLLGDKDEESDSEKEPKEDLEPIDEEENKGSEEDLDLASELSKELNEDFREEPEGEDDIDLIFGDEEETDEEDEVSEPAESESSGDDMDKDFDDPFEALAGDEEDEEPLEDSNIESEEVVPVIKNLASKGAKKKRESEKAEIEDDKQPEKTKATKKIKSPRDGQSQQPVMLWVLLIILLIGGGTYGLGYFGIVTIPGITPKPPVATNIQTPKPAQQPVTQPTQPEQKTPQITPEQVPEQKPEEAKAAVTEPNNTPPQEQESEVQVSGIGEAPAGQPVYGLKGVPVQAANVGYTIVIYSLSKKSNADAKQTELSQEGYRVLVVALPSKQYGTLWRVSLGQFKSLRDAALAAETLADPFLENYFITKIK